MRRSWTRQTLRAGIAARGGTLETGFIGTAIALDALTEQGLSDVAYDLLLNHKFPGWLYSVDQGATTIWERWDCNTKDKGLGKPSWAISFNHYAHGSVLVWIYKMAAGIASDAGLITSTGGMKARRGSGNSRFRTAQPRPSRFPAKRPRKPMAPERIV